MAEFLDAVVTHFLEPRHWYPTWLLSAIIPITLLIGGYCFTQTETFLLLIEPLSNEKILKGMSESKAIQDTIRSDVGLEDPVKNSFVDINKDHQTAILNARDFSERDALLQQKLKQRFGKTFEGINVVFTRMESAQLFDDPLKAGITSAALAGDVEVARKTDSADAVTIRDRPGLAQQTTDGIPRIILKQGAFHSTRTLRRTIYHELLHAMGVPAYKHPITWWQNDLQYLPEHRWFNTKNGLRDLDECWVPAIGTQFFCLVSLGHLIHLVRRKKRPNHHA